MIRVARTPTKLRVANRAACHSVLGRLAQAPFDADERVTDLGEQGRGGISLCGRRGCRRFGDPVTLA